MKRLLRSRRNNVITGVCGGLAEYLGMDPIVVRILWVVASFITAGTAVIAYVIAAIVIPDSPGGQNNGFGQQKNNSYGGQQNSWPNQQNTNGFGQQSWPRYNETYQQQSQQYSQQQSQQYTQQSQQQSDLGSDYSDINSGMDDWKDTPKQQTDKNKKVIGIVLVALGAMIFAKEVLNWMDMRIVVPVALVVIGGAIIYRGRRNSI